MVRSRVVSGAILALMAVSGTSLADQQTSGQQKCLNKVSGGGRKVTSSTIRNSSDCMKKGSAGSLPPGTTAQDCLFADLKGRIAKARLKVDSAGQSYCISPVPPDFGYTDSTLVGDAHEDEAVALVPDCFGSDLDAALAGPLAADPSAKCSAGTLSATSRISDAMLKQYLGCMKTGLKDGSITDAAGLTLCLDAITADPKGTVAKAVSKAQGKIESLCPAAPGPFFPELDGAGELCDRYGLALPLNASTLTTCLSNRMRCRICRTVNAAQDLSRNCDLFDDGSIDGTCPQCPNGVVDSGEQCDDGNASNNDLCVGNCVDATCGDGFVRTGAEECDNGDANSDTTPNACREDCTLPFCGDGVIDNANGESCDEGGVNTPTCDADCTLPTCHDGTLNLLAGEQCDDGNTVNTDACVGNCQTATCGDGYVRSGLENCDGGDCCTLLCTYALPGTSCTGTATTCVAPQCNASGACLNLPTNEGGTCDDGTICTPTSTCQSGSCVGIYGGVGAACDWAVVGATGGNTELISLNAMQSLGGGDWCGNTGNFVVSSSFSGDIVATDDDSGVAMVFADLITVNGGDIVTNNFRVNSTLVGSVSLPGVPGISTIAPGQHVLKNPNPTFYDTTGTDPRVARCQTAQASIPTTKANLDGLAGGINLGTLLKDLDINGTTRNVTAAVAGAVNVYDTQFLNGTGANVTITLDGGGNANTVMVFRISDRMNTGSNWIFNLTNGLTANHLLFYVAKTSGIENCALGLSNTGGGTIFCPRQQVHVNSGTIWSGAAYGGDSGSKGQISIGASAQLTYVPFTAALP
ncbi:MAG TPA: ice-binding family protein [Candidatus Limnocylindrales bacterium]|nr:ice-binding family protein [Candidatus Limnocylindrales bacterium]